MDGGGRRQDGCLERGNTGRSERIGELIDDGLLPDVLVPALEEHVEACELSGQGSLRIVPKALGEQFSVLVEVFDALRHDAHRLPLDMVFPWRVVPRRDDGDVRRFRVDNDHFILPGLWRNGIFPVARRRYIVRRRDGIVLARLVDLDRLAVECRIGEVVGRLPEVEQGEVILPRVFVDAGAAPDDLLEFGHRADCAVEYDQPAGLGDVPQTRNGNLLNLTVVSPGGPKPRHAFQQLLSSMPRGYALFMRRP